MSAAEITLKWPQPKVMDDKLFYNPTAICQRRAALL